MIARLYRADADDSAGHPLDERFAHLTGGTSNSVHRPLRKAQAMKMENVQKSEISACQRKLSLELGMKSKQSASATRRCLQAEEAQVEEGLLL